MYHYKVRRSGQDEDAMRLIDMDLVRGKRLVKELWEKVGGSFRQKRVPVFLREEWDWEDPTLVAGVMAQCGGELSEEQCLRCKGSGAVFDECVINPLWGTACVACLTRGAPNRCRW
ncbi:hypothetical protein KEM55_009132, partial [Ascosphaera atra]